MTDDPPPDRPQLDVLATTEGTFKVTRQSAYDREKYIEALEAELEKASRGVPWPELCAEALEVYGPDAELTKLVEEVAETILAISRSDPVSKIYEEMVGVESTLTSLRLWVEDELGKELMTMIEDEQRDKLKQHIRREVGLRDPDL